MSEDARPKRAADGSAASRAVELVRNLRQQCHALEDTNRQLIRSVANVTQHRAWLHNVFELAGVGYCTVNRGGTLIELDACAGRLLGVRPHQAFGKPFASFVAPGDAGLLRQHMLAAWGKPYTRQSVELRMSHGEGKNILVRLNSLTLANEAFCLVVMTDLTELNAVREYEELFRSLAAHVEDVYYRTDGEGCLLQVSSGYREVWGRDLEGVAGQPWFHAVHPDDRLRADQARHLLLKGDPFDEEYRIVRPNGEVRWVRDRAITVAEPSLQILGVARDVTEDRALEEELRQAQKLEALGTLASSLAHDFGNLLQGLTGCLNLALDEATSPDRRRDYVHQALMAARGGSSLVAQLMRFGRKERAKATAMSLDLAIAQCATLLERLLGENVELTIEAGAPHSTIMAKPSQIEQILMNLTTNARDAMPQGGRFSIRTLEVPQIGETPAHVRLDVRDSGCGMSQETKARLFQPFLTTKAAGQGTGLGLSSVLSVTRSLGGEVEVESELGRGTCFTFRFPVRGVLPAEPSRPAASARFKGRALLVEDDPRVRAGLRHYLEELGFDVVSAKDATEALANAEGELSLLVSDIVLPDVSGPKIMDMLRSQYPDLKALYISAHPPHYLLGQGLLKKGDSLLQKPFELSELSSRLHELWPQRFGFSAPAP